MTGPEAIARWRRLRERSGCPTPFAHEDVVSGIARAARLRIEAVFREIDGFESGCLLYVRRRGPLAQVVVPPFCFYTALILPSGAPTDVRDRLLVELLDGVRDVSPDANVVLPPEMDPPAGEHLPAAWSVSEFRTFRATVRPVDEAVHTWSGGSRRRFSNHADEFQLESGPDTVPAVLTHVSDAYEKHARGLPTDRSGLERLVRDLHAAGHAEIVALRRRDSGRITAGMILMVDDITGWDWIAGSVRGPAMTVCVGRAFERLHELGVNTFDFGGANIGAIATFKRQFGGEDVTYPTLSTPSRPLYRWLSALKSRLAAGG